MARVASALSADGLLQQRAVAAKGALVRAEDAEAASDVEAPAPRTGFVTDSATAAAALKGTADAIKVATIAQQLQREKDLIDALEPPETAMREAGALLLKRREFARSPDDLLRTLADRQDIALVLPRPDAPKNQADIAAIKGDVDKQRELLGLISAAREAAQSQDDDEAATALARYAWLMETARLAGVTVPG